MDSFVSTYRPSQKNLPQSPHLSHSTILLDPASLRVEQLVPCTLSSSDQLETSLFCKSNMGFAWSPANASRTSLAQAALSVAVS